MFVDVDHETGRPVYETVGQLPFSVSEQRAKGFSFRVAGHGTPCTEVNFNGPFHLAFDNGVTLNSESFESEYLGVRSTHRIVLAGSLPCDKIAFEAVPGLSYLND